jgi:hypothetical protein
MGHRNAKTTGRFQRGYSARNQVAGVIHVPYGQSRYHRRDPVGEVQGARALDEEVGEVLVGRIIQVLNGEGTARLGQGATNGKATGFLTTSSQPHRR